MVGLVVKLCAFVVLLLFPVFVFSFDASLNDDVLGLIVFKAGLQDPFSNLQSWNDDDVSPCNWVGIKCDPKTNRVTHVVLDGLSLSGHIGRGLLRLQSLQVLSLSNNNFNGSINPDFIQLSGLQIVDFSFNDLSGNIPDGFFKQCGSLKSVSFAGNSLTGQIPDSLCYCGMLTNVNFSSNKLSGYLPSGFWFLRGLQVLDLSDNFIEGEIPDGIGNLYDLRELNLRRNKLYGWIPADIGSVLSLKVIDFSENMFSGSIPESVQRLSSCTSIRLRGNFFTGEVPEWIGELESIESLDLSANNFSGQIPSMIGNLSQLKELNLSNNQLTGGLPESLTKCLSLLTVDVSQNRLTGNLPSWIFKMGIKELSVAGNRLTGSIQYPSTLVAAASHQNLQEFDVSLNSLSGQIPSNIGNLGSLVRFNVSRNQLIGPLPSSIGDLKALQVLDASDNRINGSIPSEVGGAISLLEMRLERNFLSGDIPTEISKCTSLMSLILSQNNLTGSVPVAIANLSNLQYLDLSFNNLTESLPKEFANLSHLLLFNVSHNNLEGELPVGGFFNTLSPSSVFGNPSLCGSVVKRSCPAVHPKPIVLNPNSSNSSNSSALNNHHRKTMLSISALIAIGAAALITLGVLTVTILNIHVRSSRDHAPATLMLSGGEDFSCSPTNDPNFGKLVMFSGDANFVTGAQALLNKDAELGRGGFGAVYRTILQDGRSVSIKKLTVSSLIKSQEEFEKEVKTLGKIRHRNLVSLEGYYWTPSLHLLIYEYVPGGSLYKNLHDDSSTSSLSWRQRFNIILGMAKGLAHLHQTNTIHYNLKSTNILLDEYSEPKVGDFGLARLLPTLDRCILSSKIQSALGYMAPEFACRTVKITEKCDVYGFGVLVLEVVTGKRPVEYMEDDVVVLCDMVRGALEDGRVEECIDRRLVGNYPADEAIPVIKLGLICASQVPSNRPDMEEVVNILELIQCPAESQELEWIKKTY